MSRFVSVLMKVEVEVLDPTALEASLLLDVSDDLTIQSDDPDAAYPETLSARRQEQEFAAIRNLLRHPLGRAELAKMGLAVKGGSCYGRWLREGVYDEVTIGRERARNDDGTLDL